MDDMTNFQRNYSIGEVEIHGSAIYHKTASTGKEETITLFTPSMLRLPDLIQVVMHFLVRTVKIRLLKLSYPAPAKFCCKRLGSGRGHQLDVTLARANPELMYLFSVMWRIRQRENGLADRKMVSSTALLLKNY